MTTEELIKALREKPSRDNRALLDEAAAEIEKLKAPRYIIEERPLSKKEMRETCRYGFFPEVRYTIKRIDEEGIRAEAVKEFADKVLDLVYEADGVNPISEWQIRNLVKEFTEGQE